MDTEDEKEELMDELKEISQSLNTTISHLKEIVSVNSKTSKALSKISIQKIVDDSLKIVSDKKTGASFFTNFSELQDISYISA